MPDCPDAAPPGHSGNGRLLRWRSSETAAGCPGRQWTGSAHVGRRWQAAHHGWYLRERVRGPQGRRARSDYSTEPEYVATPPVPPTRGHDVSPRNVAGLGNGRAGRTRRRGPARSKPWPISSDSWANGCTGIPDFRRVVALPQVRILVQNSSCRTVLRPRRSGSGWVRCREMKRPRAAFSASSMFSTHLQQKADVHVSTMGNLAAVGGVSPCTTCASGTCGAGRTMK